MFLIVAKRFRTLLRVLAGYDEMVELGVRLSRNRARQDSSLSLSLFLLSFSLS